MTRSNAHTLRVLVRVRDWIARNQVTAPLGDLTGYRAQLDAMIQKLSDLGDQARTQTRAARTGTMTAKQQARRIRRAYLKPVVRAGQLMTGSDTESLRALTMPPEVTFEQLVSVAHEFAGLVEQHQAAFVAAGLAADAATQLRAAAAALTSAVSGRSESVGQRINSTEGARTAASAGRKLVRLIDAHVQPAIETNPALQAEWRALVKLTDRTGGGVAEDTPTVVTPPSTVPALVPVAAVEVVKAA